MSRRKASKVSSLARKKGKAARRGEGGTHSGAPRKRTRRLLEAGGMLSHTISVLDATQRAELARILKDRRDLAYLEVRRLEDEFMASVERLYASTYGPR